MILKTKSMPEWLNNFANSLAGNKKEAQSKNVISYEDAEKLGFFKKSNLLGDNTFEVTAGPVDDGFFDSGSIWYMEENADGQKFLMKQTDEAGNIIRRMNNLQKKASKTIEAHKTNEIAASLNHIQANMGSYDPYKVKDEINEIEDSIVTSDPTLQKSSSVSIIGKINIIRAIADSRIKLLKAEYDGDSVEPESVGTLLDTERKLTDLNEERVAELKETKASLEEMVKNDSDSMAVSQYENALAEVNKEIQRTVEGEATKDITKKALFIPVEEKKENEEEKENDALPKEASIQTKADTGLPASPAAPARAATPGEITITEKLFNSPDEAQTDLEQYKKDNSGDISEYDIGQDTSGGTGKFKITKKARSFDVVSGRVHQGRLVRFLEVTALSYNTNVIKCTTPNCEYNDNVNNICNKRMISVSNGDCTDMTEMSTGKKASMLSLSDRDVKSEMEKEIPSDPIKEVSPPDNIDAKTDDAKLAPDATEDRDKKLVDIKSQVWEQSGKEAIDENLDFKRAEDSFYAKIINNLEDKLKVDEIDESEYNALLDELEQLKEDGILEEYLEEELLYETTKKDVGEEEKKDEGGLPQLPKEEVTSEEPPDLEEELK